MSNTPLLQNGVSPLEGAKPGPSVTVGVLRDPLVAENRVSLPPDLCKEFIKDGFAVVVESGAGLNAGFADEAFHQAGCEVCARHEVISKAKLFFSLNAPVDDFAALSGKTLVSWVGRMLPEGKEIVQKAARAGVMLIDVTAVPRISIAQKLDVLSSQAKVAGHRAVIEAAHNFGRFHSAEITAAGKYAPSHTLVLGCGVAGLAAIGSSRQLGSVVRAWDVRDVSDQVISMGGSWVTVDFNESGAGAGGYAKESSAEFQKVQKATFHKHLKEVDIVITTAAIPGRASPRLIEDYMVRDMKPGSVIVDLAAIGGGNCALTKRGETIVTPNGVTIIGLDNLPGQMPAQASSMYGHNMLAMVRHIGGKEKAAGFYANLMDALNKGESGDIITRSIVCTMNGKELVMPPPPQPTPVTKKEAPKAIVKKEANPFKVALCSAVSLTLICAFLVLLGDGVATSQLATFVLAGAAGYQVVWGVSHSLHTPLMSVTNAISGMTAVGGLILLDKSDKNPFVVFLASLSIVVSCVNVVGGFVISKRMLNLFKRSGDQDFSYLMCLPGIVLIIGAIFVKEFVGPISIVAALLCIGAIGCLAAQKTANTGCMTGIVGVATGLVSTLMIVQESWLVYMVILMTIGAIGGSYIGLKVDPMALPQTVAAFHSLVGLAAMLSSIGDYQSHQTHGFSMQKVFCMLGNFIGAITLTGSLVAFGKLNGNLSSKALNLPMKNYINLAALALFVVAFYAFLSDNSYGILILWLVAIGASLLGIHLVGSVGGGDMPVCVTVLNSYSGWALVSEGFMLDSPMLTIVGSLIGFSGAILTKIMCDAMNRDIFNVIFGGINVAAPVKKGITEPQVHVETNPDNAADVLAAASNVLIVPGYGMAAGRAQTPVAEIARTLIANNVKVRFGIHPVAGRMPGQMNVLLAEAGVPYDWVEEMDEVNPDMEKFDVCLVIGANDITNSAAQEMEGCPIYGMPVIEVWRAKKTIFFKRSMGGGYADIENPVFFKENTEMLLGNAKTTCDQLASKLKEIFKVAV